MITIPDNKFNQIMTCLGGKFIQEDDLEISYDDIKNDIISQALAEYYRWYPIASDPFITMVQGNFSFPFPDDSVFNVLDVRQNVNRAGGFSPVGNALIDERYIQNTGSYGYGGKYGTRNNYGFSSANVITRTERQTAIETNKAFKWTVNEQKRVLTGFSNTACTISITWASWSNDWQYVAYSQDRDVIKLSQAYVLRFFGELRSQEQTDGAPIELDSSQLLERADELEDEVMEKWKNKSVPIMLRN